MISWLLQIIIYIAICDAIVQEEEMTFYKKNIVAYIGGFAVKD